MKKMTEGNIVKQILLFLFPVFLGAVLQRLYTLADTMLVGRFVDTKALAAVGSSSILYTICLTICNGFTGGFSIVIGQHYGAGEESEVRKTIAGTYTLSLILVAFLTVSGLLAVGPLLKLIRVPQELVHDARIYLTILIAGLITTMIYNMTANILRALGDSLMPLIFLIISVILNIFFDMLFIIVLHKGVFGAAIATVIAQGVSCVLCIVFGVLRRPIMIVKKEDFKFSNNILHQLISQGSAMALMWTVVDAGSVVLQAGINVLGADMVAGYTAGRRYLELLMIPGGSLAQTAAAFVSQNFGARQYKRIKDGVRKMILISWIWATFTVLLVYLFARSLVVFITGVAAAENIIQAGILYMKTGVPFFYTLFVLVIVRSSLQAINKKKTPIVASAIELIVKILSTSFAVSIFGFMAICFTEPVIWVLGMLWVWPNFRWNINKLCREEAA